MTSLNTAEMIVNDVIKCVRNSINKILKCPSQPHSEDIHSQLIETYNLFDQLLMPDMLTNKRTRLFCRQLKRLMDYNELLPKYFWTELHDDILHILEEPNDAQDKGSRWKLFLNRIEFEDKLEQRELQFQRTFGDRKSLDQLFCEHQKFFEEYLHKCICLHSKVQVRGLVENIDDLFRNGFGQTEVLLTPESQKRIKEKINSIKIPFDCSNKSLNNVYSTFFVYNKSSAIINNSYTHFLPSVEPLQTVTKKSNVRIFDALSRDRWFVILGDPGSAKTTLLRWLTRVFAEAAHRGDREVALKRDDRDVIYIPVRIPILIRIGEFATWFDYHKDKTLIDYIGKHTWLSQPYIHNDDGSVLRELIDHGHAFILLDGLDEIPEIGRRGEIVDLVRKFIEEYMNAPDFFTAFDDKMFNKRTLFDDKEIVETQRPNKSGGNQIIITSRIVGYHLHPLIGPFIRHYSLLLMDREESKGFVNKWLLQVEKDVLEVLLNEGINVAEETVEALSKKRYNAVQSMFDNDSESLMSNPSLLSLVCAFIFQLPDECHLKSRVEVYNHAVQAALRSWRSQESSISERVITNFLIDLATYLHLQSPSGLIDAYDMEQLCCLTLQQQSLSNDRTKLRQYAKKLILLLDDNVGIVAERGLQVFGFLHLSFQEYFVALSFVQGSFDEVAKRILTFIINPRFREPLLLALVWISWKWRFDAYDKFCNLLVIPTKNYAIPFGALLFFDVFNSLQRLPSNPVIYTALNSLLDHPSRIVAVTYLISNLFKLSEDVILEWMQLNLKDITRLTKFCHCLLPKLNNCDGISPIKVKSMSLVIYQQLRSCDNINISSEFLIDQTLRELMTFKNAFDGIFNSELLSYLSSTNICATDIHPLILSVIIAICGGIDSEKEGEMLNTSFSPQNMHCESSVIPQIIEYLDDPTKPHEIKVETLITRYESILQKSSTEDASIDIVDTFIALICLQGLSQPLIYRKYHEYRALPIALERLKRTWFYLRKTYNRIFSLYGAFFITSKIKSIVRVFSAQTDQSDERRIVLLLACAAACNKLDIRHSLDWFKFDIFRSSSISRYLQCQSKCSHSIIETTRNQRTENIHLLKVSQQSLFFLLTFVPQSLRQLYYSMITASSNNLNSLPLVVFLAQCLSHLEDVPGNVMNDCLALSMVQPLLKEYMLEYYGSMIFYEKYLNDRSVPEERRDFFKVMVDCILLGQFNGKCCHDWTTSMDMIRQRINDAKNVEQNLEKDLQVFAASISLAQLFQQRNRSRKYYGTENVDLSSVERKEVSSAVESIHDSVIRIFAVNIILDMKDPTIFNEAEKDKLRWEMINVLQSLLPDLPLLTSTLLFVCCHTTRQVFPTPFKHMAKVIGEKLNETSSDQRIQEKKAAFLALRQLNNSDLSHCLSEFAKQTKNLSDLLGFNSTIFHRYFTTTTSFDSSNTILLSSIYLTELAFDVQILNMYITNTRKTEISLLKEWKQLWDHARRYMQTLNLEAATWITNNLHTLNKKEIDEIIVDVSDCVVIKMEAYPAIEKWLSYRMNKDLRFFSLYAALQLIIEGSDIPGLIDIINEMFVIDSRFRLQSIVEYLFELRFANLSVVRQILIALNENIRYSSQIFVWIYYKKMLKLILRLELERITSNVNGLSVTSTNSFLSMIRDCSEDLKLYLAKYLRKFLHSQTPLQHVIKDEYLAVLVKWIIQSSIWKEKRTSFVIKLYKFIFTLLHDQRFPRVQKAILNALNLVFINFYTEEAHIFIQDNVIVHLEKVICSSTLYSDDVVAICLLSYCNYLLILDKYKIFGNVSNKMHTLLNTLFETSESEIISIRAAYCLIFVHRWDIMSNTILNWFRNKLNITPEKRYNLLLQQLLYNVEYNSSDKDMDEIVEHLQTYSDKIMIMFVLDLYNYLCDKDSSNYLSDPTPDYINIALKLNKKNFNIFHNIMQRTSFGAEQFKKELYYYFDRVNEQKDCEALVELYARFGVITVELIRLLEWIEDRWGTAKWEYFGYIKQVSDQNVIDKLFQLLDSVVYDNSSKRFSYVLRLLIRLAQAHVVSLLEVHQRVSFVISKLSHLDEDKNWNVKNHIFNHLLDLSCIKKVPLSTFPKTVTLKNNIDKKFEKKIQNFDKKSNPLLREIFFLSFFNQLRKVPIDGISQFLYQTLGSSNLFLNNKSDHDWLL